jgi:hypothetical protein
MRRDDYNFSDILETIRVKQEESKNVLAVLVDADDASAEQTQAFNELKERLRQLMNFEENGLYVSLAALGVDEETLVDSALDQHEDIENALVDLEAGITTPKITTLFNAVETHFTTERQGLFAAARTGLNTNQKQELAMKAGDAILGV